MSLMKKLAGETAYYGLSSIVGRFLNYLLVPLYTRTLLKEEYGVVTEFYAYSAFAMVVLSYRMESAFFRFGAKKEARETAFSTAMWSILATTVTAVALIFLFSEPIARETGHAEHPEYFRWFALILGFDALCEIPFAKLRLEQRPRKFALAKLLNIGLNIFFNLFFLVLLPKMSSLNFFEGESKVGFIFISNLLASSATFLILMPEMRGFQAGFDTTLWKKMLRFSGPLVIVGFAGIVDEMLGRISLKWLLPGTLIENEQELGVFAANYKLAMLISLFTQAYRFAAEPFFFRQNEEKNAHASMAEATKWFAFISTIGMVGVVLFLEIFKKFIGPEYRSGLAVVPILLLANWFLGLYYNFSVWYRLADRTGLGAWISIAGAALTFLLNFLLIPKLGYVGSSLATVSCYIFMSWATWATGRRYFFVEYDLAKMGIYLLGAMVVGVVSWFSRPFFDEKLWLGLSFNAILFSCFLTFLWSIEKKAIKQLLKKKKSDGPKKPR